MIKIMKKDHDILYEDENRVIINFNKHIEKQLEDDDFTISENHTLISSIENDYSEKNPKK